MYHFFYLILFLSSFCFVLSNYYASNGDINIAPMEVFSNYTLSTYISQTLRGSWSLGPYVNLAQNFVKGLVDSLKLQNLLTGTFLPGAPPLVMQNFISELIKLWTYILIFVVMGLILIIAMPLFGSVVCCCRCCCRRCGAEVSLEEAEAQNRLCSYIIAGIFGFGVILLLVGSLSMFTVSSRVPNVPKVLNQTVDKIFSDIYNYLADISWEVKQLAYDDMLYVTNLMETSAATFSDHLMEPFMNLLRPKIQLIATDIGNILTAMTNLENELHALDAMSRTIIISGGIIKNELANISSQMTQIKQQCLIDGLPFCNSLPDNSIVPIAPNFNYSIPTFQMQKELLQDSLNMNFANVSNTMETTFNDLPLSANKSTLQLRQNIVNQLASVPDMVNSSLLMPLHDALFQASAQIAGYEGQSKGYTDVLVPYMDTANAILICIGFVILLVACLSAVGLGLGITAFFKVPTDRTNINDCGADIVAASIYLSILMVSFVLFVGEVLLLFSSFTVPVCQILETRSFTAVIDDTTRWNGYYLGDLVLHNPNISLKSSNVLSECKDDMALWQVLMLDQVYNISALLNIEQHLPDMSGFGIMMNSSLQGLNVIDDATITDFSDLLRSNTSILDSDALTADLYADINSINLQPLVDALKNASLLTSSFPAYAAKYNTSIYVAHTLNSVTIPAVRSNVDSFKAAIPQLSIVVSALTTKISDTLTQIKDFNFVLKIKGADEILSDANSLILQIVGYAQVYIDFVVKEMHTEFAKCGLFYNIIDALISAICDYMLACVYAVWLSLILAGVGMVLLVCMGIHLTKYFRIPKEKDEQSRPRPMPPELEDTTLKPSVRNESIDSTDEPLLEAKMTQPKALQVKSKGRASEAKTPLAASVQRPSLMPSSAEISSQGYYGMTYCTLSEDNSDLEQRVVEIKPRALRQEIVSKTEMSLSNPYTYQRQHNSDLELESAVMLNTVKQTAGSKNARQSVPPSSMRTAHQQTFRSSLPAASLSQQPSSGETEKDRKKKKSQALTDPNENEPILSAQPNVVNLITEAIGKSTEKEANVALMATIHDTSQQPKPIEKTKGPNKDPNTPVKSVESDIHNKPVHNTGVLSLMKNFFGRLKKTQQ